MTDAFYADTVERIYEAIKGPRTIEQKIATIHALAHVMSTLLLAVNGKYFDEGLIERIGKRLIDVNVRPHILKIPDDDYRNYFTEMHRKFADVLTFTTDDELYVTLCALASLIGKMIVGYKTKGILAEEEQLFRIMTRILDVNTDENILQ